MYVRIYANRVCLGQRNVSCLLRFPHMTIKGFHCIVHMYLYLEMNSETTSGKR